MSGQAKPGPPTLAEHRRVLKENEKLRSLLTDMLSASKQGMTICEIFTGKDGTLYTELKSLCKRANDLLKPNAEA